jgi:hypothetical protein
MTGWRHRDRCSNAPDAAGAGVELEAQASSGRSRVRADTAGARLTARKEGHEMLMMTTHTPVSFLDSKRRTWAYALLVLCCACTAKTNRGNTEGIGAAGTGSASAEAGSNSTTNQVEPPRAGSSGGTLPDAGSTAPVTPSGGTPPARGNPSGMKDAGADEDATMTMPRVSGNPKGAPDPDTIRASLAAAICDALQACVGTAALPVLTAREDCKSYYTTALTEDDLGGLDQAIASGSIAIDPDQLEACYHDTKALGCKVQTDRLPTSCDMAIQGKRAAGESCRLNAECGSGQFCPITAGCPRTCQKAKATGDKCSRDDECQRGLLCMSGACGAPAADNAACGGIANTPCILGDSCAGGTDTMPGSCSRDATIQVGDVNASCNPSTGPWCRDGLSCAYDGAAGFKCVAPANKGAMCRMALPSQCPNDSYCNAADPISMGTCTALPGDGQPCTAANACAPGHLCIVANASAAGVCHRWLKLGDACTDSNLCRSGSCVQGHCALRAQCM